MRSSAAYVMGIFTIISAVALVNAAQQNPVSKRAVPLEPIAAIIDAFHSHAIVALGDNHGNEQGHAFRLSLIRYPKFAATVNDIVVEFGNARYQDVMDRFVRGEDVPMKRSAKFGRTPRRSNTTGSCRSTKISSRPCAP